MVCAVRDTHVLAAATGGGKLVSLVDLDLLPLCPALVDLLPVPAGGSGHRVLRDGHGDGGSS